MESNCSRVKKNLILKRIFWPSIAYRQYSMKEMQSDQQFFWDSNIQKDIRLLRLGWYDHFTFLAEFFLNMAFTGNGSSWGLAFLQSFFGVDRVMEWYIIFPQGSLAWMKLQTSTIVIESVVGVWLSYNHFLALIVWWNDVLFFLKDLSPERNFRPALLW